MDSHKVLNTTYSNPIVFPVIADASIKSVGSIEFSCGASVAPKIELKNSGTPALTSAKITYKIDNGANQIFNFTGNLASGATTAITLPIQNISTSGSHNISATVSLPNGVTDVETSADTKNGTFFVFSNPNQTPITQAFSGAVPPSSSWLITDPDGNDSFMDPSDLSLSSSGSASGGGAAFLPLNWQKPGNKDEMYMPSMNLGANPVLTFYVSAAPNLTGSDDKLEVLVSKNCGLNWTSVYSKIGSNLYTAPPNPNSWFEPSSNSLWRMETASLSQVANSSDVLLKFVVTAGSANNKPGNSLWLDDINITSTVGVDFPKNTLFEQLSIYPNPTKETATLKYQLSSNEIFVLKITNLLGQVVYKDKISGLLGENSIQLNTSNFTQGMYHIILTNTTETKVVKLMIEN